jgi:hypothetical protein
MMGIGEKMDNVTISEVLIKRNKRICASKDIAEITSKKDYLRALSSLINTKWIVPVGFRGIYYVKDPEERSRSFLKLDNFQILNKVLNIVFGNEWYFGRITSLSLSGRIHQPVSTYYILNRKFSRTFTSDILGKIVLMKTSAGILCRKYLPDKEKIIDIIVRCYPKMSAIKMFSIIKEVYK